MSLDANTGHKTKIDVQDIEVKVKLKRFQKEILEKAQNLDNKFLVIVAARQTGKSFSLRLFMLKIALEERSSKIAYITLTNKLGREFFSLVCSTFPKGLILKANSQELGIELVNHSRIYFLSIESIENIRGFTFEYMIIDECAFARERTPDGQNIFNNILLPTLDAKGKKCVIVSTPNGKKGLFWEAYSKAKKGEKGWDLIENTILDDETKTLEWIEQKKRETTELAFKQEYLCEFLDDGASFFTGYIDKFTFTGELEGKVYMAIDFSSVGEDNTILTAIDSEGNTKQWVIDGTLDEKYKKIANLIDLQENLAVCFCENNSIGTVMINEIKKLTKNRGKIVEFNTNSKTKPDIINLLARDIEQGFLHFEPSNKLLFSELGTFTYTVNPNTHNVSYAAMTGFHDDTVMSLAICNYARNTKKNTGGRSIFVG